jgi:hypothetical protein
VSAALSSKVPARSTGGGDLISLRDGGEMPGLSAPAAFPSKGVPCLAIDCSSEADVQISRENEGFCGGLKTLIRDSSEQAEAPIIRPIER